MAMCAEHEAQREALARRTRDGAQPNSMTQEEARQLLADMDAFLLLPRCPACEES